MPRRRNESSEESSMDSFTRLLLPVLFLIGFVYNLTTLSVVKLPTDPIVASAKYSFSMEGIFSFTNVILFVAGLGIVVALIPALAEIAKVMNLSVLLALMLDYFDIIGYLVSGALIYIGTHQNSTVGYWNSLLGCGLATGSFVATLLHLPSKGDIQRAAVLIHLFNFICLTPLTVVYSSSLYGFLSVAMLMGAFGFTIVCDNLCWSFGFRGDAVLQRSTLASLFILGAYTAVRFANVAPVYIEPFSLGVHVMGNIVLMLALLIISSEYYDKRQSYGFRQFCFVVAVFINLFVGFVYTIPAMASVGCTFLGLYLSFKVHEFVSMFGRFVWIWIFVISAAAFQGALLLKRYPDVVSTFFGVQ